MLAYTIHGSNIQELTSIMMVRDTCVGLHRPSYVKNLSVKLQLFSYQAI